MLIHTLSPSSSPTTSNLNLPIRFTNTNSNGSTTNVSLSVWTAAVRKLGNSIARPVYRHLSGAGTFILKISPGTLYTLVIGKAGGLVSVYDNDTGAATNPISLPDLTDGLTPADPLDFFRSGLYVAYRD